MATQITNQATLTYQYGSTTATAASNVATAILQGPLAVEKTSLSTGYRMGQDITYILRMSNNASAALNNVQIVDDLGGYTGPSGYVRPLTYVGPAQLYVNGAYTGPLTPSTAAGGVTFTIPSLAAGANALILYKAVPNEYALRDAGAALTNEASFSAAGVEEAETASHTLPAESYADVHIIKTMSPNPVTDGSQITYTFTLYNYGNAEAGDVVLSDSFSPAPTGIVLSLNGSAVDADAYEYTGGVLRFPGPNAAERLSIPAATFTQAPATGLVTVTPGTVTIQATGTI